MIVQRKYDFHYNKNNYNYLLYYQLCYLVCSEVQLSRDENPCNWLADWTNQLTNQPNIFCRIWGSQSVSNENSYVLGHKCWLHNVIVQQIWLFKQFLVKLFVVNLNWLFFIQCHWERGIFQGIILIYHRGLYNRPKWPQYQGLIDT
jgi:hypothetical protein